VGDHTWDHVSVNGMTASELDAEIGHTRRVASSDAGEPVFLFRPPLGQHDPGGAPAYLGADPQARPPDRDRAAAPHDGSAVERAAPLARLSLTQLRSAKATTRAGGRRQWSRCIDWL